MSFMKRPKSPSAELGKIFEFSEDEDIGTQTWNQFAEIVGPSIEVLRSVEQRYTPGKSGLPILASPDLFNIPAIADSLFETGQFRSVFTMLGHVWFSRMESAGTSSANEVASILMKLASDMIEGTAKKDRGSRSKRQGYEDKYTKGIEKALTILGGLRTNPDNNLEPDGRDENRIELAEQMALADIVSRLAKLFKDVERRNKALREGSKRLANFHAKLEAALGSKKGIGKMIVSALSKDLTSRGFRISDSIVDGRWRNDIRSRALYLKKQRAKSKRVKA